MSIGAIDLFTQLVHNDFGFFQKVQSAADVMTRDPKTLGLDDTLQNAVDLFRRNGIHHAPVISPEDGDVVGIVSDRDVLRQYPYFLGTLQEGDDDQRALRTTVSQFMTRGVIHVGEETPPFEVVTAMLENHVDSVLVFDDPKSLDGIITPRDWIRVLLLYHQVCTRKSGLERLRIVDLDLAQGIPVDLIFSRGAQTVRDVMTKNVEYINDDTTIANAIELMQTLEIRHLPVVNRNEQFVGMLSDREILKWLPVPKCGPATQEDARFRSVLFATDDNQSTRELCREIMVKQPFCVTPVTLLVDVLSHFASDAVSGVPVLDDDGRLCGIVTTTEVLRVCRVLFQLSAVQLSV